MPKVAVTQPASQASREVEESRLVAWVHRMLRRSQNKLARDASELRPSISLQVRRLPSPCAAPGLRAATHTNRICRVSFFVNTLL